MALIAILTGIYHMSGGITSKADIYYVHWAAYLTFEPEKAIAAFQDSVSAAPGHDAVYRSRKQAAANYLALSATSYLGSKLFPDELVRPIIFGHSLALALAIGIFFFAMRAAQPMVHAMGLVIAFYAIQGLLTGPGATDHLLSYGGIKDVMNFFILILAPGEAFSVLSFWPKSTVILLAGTALCLRSNGKLHIAYGILLIAQIFHASLGAIFFASFMIMDIALRRPQLSWKKLFPMLIVSAWMFSRSQWHVFADTGHGGFFLIGLGLSVLLAFIAHPFIAPYFTRFRTLTADVLLICCAAGIAIPASILIFVLSGPDDLWAPVSVYLQLATRLLIFVVFAVALLLANYAVDWLRAREALQVEGVLILIVCVMTGYAAVGGWWWQSKTISARMHNPTMRAATEIYGLPYYLGLEKLSTGKKGFKDRPARRQPR
jgi:hypothetical protein